MPDEKEEERMQRREPGLLTEVEFKVTLAFGLVMAAIVLIVLYTLAPSIRAHLTFGAAVVGGAAVVYGGYYAGASLHESIARSKKEQAFRLLENLERVGRVVVLSLIDKEISNKEISPKDLYERIISDHNLLVGVNGLLGNLDDCYIAIKHDMADEAILYTSLKFLVPWVYFGLQHYVEQERRRARCDDLYIGIEKLAYAWKESKSVLSGRPFPPVG